MDESKWFETFPGHKMTFLILKYKHRLLNILNTSTLQSLLPQATQEWFRPDTGREMKIYSTRERQSCALSASVVHSIFSGWWEDVLKPNLSFMPEAVGSHSPNDLATQCLAHWATEAIILAHSNQGLQPTAGLRAHFTWSLATLWAFFRDVDLGEICATARWASPLTFVRFSWTDACASSTA